ncbi:uncharacterized protein ACHE_70248A [Aspergillus chevalieri]|uniref:Uncharacterized protein n=1 Tax=Aspergillus chevalieri TaxID=182096 RepID=A0A7R7VVI3_ASPCH|nr:uncharacterized protein ACHE_70248A [Aspergillus chevalieri]BCR91405.1 hypothetical protein ACHE_70248A [Aspergillus chevalieri]
MSMTWRETYGGDARKKQRKLRVFWTRERLATWLQANYEDRHQGAEKLQNLLSLDRSTHILYGTGWFGLEPLNAAPDGAWMNVQSDGYGRESGMLLLSLPLLRSSLRSSTLESERLTV